MTWALHLANILILCSFLVRDILILRLLSIIAGIFFLILVFRLFIFSSNPDAQNKGFKTDYSTSKKSFSLGDNDEMTPLHTQNNSSPEPTLEGEIIPPLAPLENKKRKDKPER